LGGQTDSQDSSLVSLRVALVGYSLEHANRKKKRKKEKRFKTDISCISSANNRLINGQTVKNLRRLECKFDLDQSERKSLQVNANARQVWPDEVARGHKFSTCVYLLVRLARA